MGPQVDGVSYVTQALNQHIPTYCGSCWAHAALSSLADRLKIMGKDTRADVIPSVQVQTSVLIAGGEWGGRAESWVCVGQVMINCGTAGSCHGGDSNAANAWGKTTHHTLLTYSSGGR